MTPSLLISPYPLTTTIEIAPKNQECLITNPKLQQAAKHISDYLLQQYQDFKTNVQSTTPHTHLLLSSFEASEPKANYVTFTLIHQVVRYSSTDSNQPADIQLLHFLVNDITVKLFFRLLEGLDQNNHAVIHSPAASISNRIESLKTLVCQQFLPVNSDPPEETLRHWFLSEYMQEENRDKFIATLTDKCTIQLLKQLSLQLGLPNEILQPQTQPLSLQTEQCLILSDRYPSYRITIGLLTPYTSFFQTTPGLFRGIVRFASSAIAIASLNINSPNLCKALAKKLACHPNDLLLVKRVAIQLFYGSIIEILILSRVADLHSSYLGYLGHNMKAVITDMHAMELSANLTAPITELSFGLLYTLQTLSSATYLAQQNVTSLQQSVQPLCTQPNLVNTTLVHCQNLQHALATWLHEPFSTLFQTMHHNLTNNFLWATLEKSQATANFFSLSNHLNVNLNVSLNDSINLLLEAQEQYEASALEVNANELIFRTIYNLTTLMLVILFCRNLFKLIGHFYAAIKSNT